MVSRELADIIARSYQLFEQYKIGQTLAVCKACCISDAAEAELVGTPLRTISSRLLQNSYYESAQCGSNQELREMKHFLPRVLELAGNFDFPCHSTEITFTRLYFGQAERWPAEEAQLLEAYSVAYFKQCLTHYPYLPDGSTLADILVMFGIAGFPLEPLLHCWECTATLNSVLHLSYFVVNELEYEAQNPCKIVNAFSESFVDSVVLDWLIRSSVKNKFSAAIEQLFMQQADLDDDLAHQLSWTYEFLTK